MAPQNGPWSNKNLKKKQKKLALTIIFTQQPDFFISGQKAVPDVEEEDLEETEKQLNIQSLPAHLQLLLSLLQVEKFIHQS